MIFLRIAHPRKKMDVRNQKIKILIEIDRIVQRGYSASKILTVDNDLWELKLELELLKHKELEHYSGLEFNYYKSIYQIVQELSNKNYN